MGRANFADILKRGKVDIAKEYRRLLVLFYDGNCPIVVLAEKHFFDCPYRGTCLSLKEFDQEYKFFFPRHGVGGDIDTLLLFCEYSLNLTTHITTLPDIEIINDYHRHIHLVMEKISYEEIHNDEGMILFIPKSQPASEVAAIVPAALSYKTLEYNHHSLKGNLQAKLEILKQMADEIEPKRKKLREIQWPDEKVFFQLLNKFVRHNNNDNPIIAAMLPDETEKVYDDIYQMWLLAELVLDNIERKNRMQELLGKINS